MKYLIVFLLVLASCTDPQVKPNVQADVITVKVIRIKPDYNICTYEVRDQVTEKIYEFADKCGLYAIGEVITIPKP